MAGVEISHLCYHPSLTAAGACRLCVVEVEGVPDLVTSCSASATEGMVVWTRTEKVDWARRAALEVILSSHPLACPACEKNGDCALQAYAHRYRATGCDAAAERRSARPEDPDPFRSNPFFEHAPEKCILCGRCVRVCREVQAVGALTLAGHGLAGKVTTPYGVPLEETGCSFCGNCVGVCPVGALSPKLGKDERRGGGLRTVETVCPYCGVGCRLDLKVKSGRIVAADGGGGDGGGGAPSNGLLCVKGRFGWDFVHHPDRLTTPLVRRNGDLAVASWDEALATVAGRLKEIAGAHGPDAVAGLASGKCTNEENYLFQKLMRAGLGTNNVDQCARLGHASTVVGLTTAGLTAAFESEPMSGSMDDIARSDLIFLIGSNTTETHPVLGVRVKQAQSRGAKLICADPRRIELARLADIHLQHLPGSDVALLNGLMRVILTEGLADHAFITERTEGFEAFRAVVERYHPELVEAITGVPAGRLREAALLLGRAERASIIYGMGLCQHTTGTDNVRSLANLAMLIGIPGRRSAGLHPLRGQCNTQGACDMGVLPDLFPGYREVASGDYREALERAWGCQLSSRPGLTLAEMLTAARTGELRGLLVLGANPVLSVPDTRGVVGALRSLEFLVVQDIFLTETAAVADVVLPGASFAEKDGTFTSTEGRVQRVRQAVPPAAARPDWEVLADLGRRLGLRSNYSGPADIMEEIARVTPQYVDISYQRLDAEPGGLRRPCAATGHTDLGLPYEGTFTRRRGLFSPVDYLGSAEQPDDDYPFILTTGRAPYHAQTGTLSRHSAGLEAALPGGYVEINPAMAGELGMAAGDPVRVVSRRGSVIVRALPTEGASRGVVFMPFHFEEAPANALTNPVVDPAAKVPEYKVAAVRIERIRQVTEGQATLASVALSEKEPTERR
jgi:formate dehydrogenase alpha subunit